MGEKFIYVFLAVILIGSSLFLGCKTAETLSTKATTTPIQTSTDTTNATQTHWWDKFGTPQYGGDLVQASTQMPGMFDTINFMSSGGPIYALPLFEPDWTLDPEVYQTYLGFVPEKYCVGYAAESWEFTDEKTFTVNIHKGILWQNKPPVNGREFIASDIQEHFKRAMGPGSMVAGMLTTIESVTATDNYTVVFKFKTPSAGTGFSLIRDLTGGFESPEWAALGGTSTDSAPPQEEAPGAGPPGGGPPGGGPPAPTKVSGPLGDWHNVVGAGPWILTDFVESSTMTGIKNPTYFGHDPRFPDNQVPYVDSFRTLCIPDVSTQLAALRTGKVDRLAELSWKTADTLKKSNPELIASEAGIGSGTGVAFRNDLKPFSDIRVRKALQMALDNEAISNSFYGGYASKIPAVGAITQAYKGWAYDYNDWPQSLKDEYTYNVEKSKQLLAEAGYPDGFPTNVVQANGPPFGGEDSVEVMQIFKSYFQVIGVDMEIKVMDGITAENFLRSSKHDAMLGGHAGATFPPIRVIDMFWSKSPDFALQHIDDPVYDAARDKFISAKTEAEAAAAMVAADRRIIEQHYNVSVTSAGTFIFTQPYIKGYDWRTPFNLMRLWVDQPLKASIER